MSDLIEYEDARPDVRAVYDDIMQTRNVDRVNNFWKAIANHPPTLVRTWQTLKEIMAADGALDPLVKEMIYMAVSVTNGCDYCTASHTAAARRKGLSDAMLGELLAVIGMAHETNALARAWRVPLDD
jgi:AhpD family alkylhydroperoxidase